MKIPKILRFPVIAVILTLLFSGCDKNNNGIIPYVPVDVQININNPTYSGLTFVGGSAYVFGGSQGIVIYRNSQDQFSAFDRHSTYLPENNCRVDIDQSLLQLEDQCSESLYLIIDGSVINGPATIPLQRYQTSFSDPILHIYN